MRAGRQRGVITQMVQPLASGGDEVGSMSTEHTVWSPNRCVSSAALYPML